MKFEMKLSFRDYVRNGTETTEILLSGPNELVDAIEATYDYFAKVLWSDDPNIRPAACLSGIERLHALRQWRSYGVHRSRSSNIPVISDLSRIRLVMPTRWKAIRHSTLYGSDAIATKLPTSAAARPFSPWFGTLR